MTLLADSSFAIVSTASFAGREVSRHFFYGRDAVISRSSNYGSRLRVSVVAIVILISTALVSRLVAPSVFVVVRHRRSWLGPEVLETKLQKVNVAWRKAGTTGTANSEAIRC